VPCANASRLAPRESRAYRREPVRVGPACALRGGRRDFNVFSMTMAHANNVHEPSSSVARLSKLPAPGALQPVTT
jgi:hypothetical protein